MSASRTVVVATDGSSWSEAALTTGIEIAKAWGAKLVALSVAPAPSVFTTPSTEVLGVPIADRGVVESYQRVAEKAAVRAREEGVPDAVPVTLLGYPIDRILEYIDEVAPDLVVVGSRGLMGARRVLLGSVSAGLSQQSHCPILIARPRPPSEGKFPGRAASSSKERAAAPRRT